MQTIEISSNPKKIREVMGSVGGQIGNVWFRKREDGELKKMCYKLGVRNPKHSKAPNSDVRRSEVDRDNVQMTVYSVNSVNKEGKRGGYRTVALEGVVRVVAGGIEYKIKGR